MSMSQNSAAPILSPRHAALAAQGTPAVWAVLAMLFAFATFGALGRPTAGEPMYAALALAAGAMAVFVERRRSVTLAVLTTWVAALMSVVGVVLFLGGSGHALLIAFFVLPLAIAGLRGARALRDLPPSLRVDLRV
jgi:hypothetical protein